MARQIRKKSGIGIYHVMLRGINRQDIFEDDEDYIQMTTVLKGVTSISFDVIQKLLTVRKIITRTDPACTTVRNHCVYKGEGITIKS